jgi:exopolysaccharide production protein ExoY
MPETPGIPQMSISINSPNLTAMPQGFAPRVDHPSLSEAIGLPDGGLHIREMIAAGPPAAVPQPVGRRPKRLMDLAVAALALALAAPAMLAIAICIRAADGGPIIFAHRRVGFSGRPFDCYKFRTMRIDAAAAIEKHLAENPDAAREWQERKKLRNDPRITPFGRLLRISSLDELPQFINVLRGEMSCIGPRPVVAEELQLYGASANDYLSARPGITGLWQVSGRNSIDYAERVRLDSRYVRDWSLRRDLVIMLRTAVAVIRVDHTS